MRGRHALHAARISPTLGSVQKPATWRGGGWQTAFLRPPATTSGQAEADRRLKALVEADRRLKGPAEADRRLKVPVEVDRRLKAPAEADRRLKAPAEADRRLSKPAEATGTVSGVLTEFRRLSFLGWMPFWAAVEGEVERVSLGWTPFWTAVEGAVDCRVFSEARLEDTRRDQECVTQP